MAFLDTSAFAKRYVTERNSETVLELCARADDLVVSVMCMPELIAVLSRLVREKKLSRSDYGRIKRTAVAEMMDIDICQITSGVLDSAVALLERHALRTLDVVHVACAMAVAPDIFVSADRRQLLAAEKSGLKTLDLY